MAVGDGRPDIRHAESWLIGAADTLKKLANGETFANPREEMLGIATVLEDVAARGLLSSTTRDEVRKALEGDSNDADHDALASVADDLHIAYTLDDEY